MIEKFNRIKVHHTTEYVYETELRYAIQRIYLTPRSTGNLRIIDWKVISNFVLTNQEDSFGNIMHLLVVEKPCQKIFIQVNGLVDISNGTRRSKKTKSGSNSINVREEAFIYLFKRFTPLTTPNEEIRKNARKVFNTKKQLKSLIDLTEIIHSKVKYSKGSTGVRTTAIETWDKGAGVCQDHAHVMLAACRSLGLAARYVSGYLQGESDASEATHAWVEVWLNKWTPIDVTHGKLIDNKFLSLAVGTDYLSVSPIRGIREGGGKEKMSVNVSVAN